MNALDILILAVVLVGFVKGLMCGFFRQVVSIVGFLAGLWVAFMLYSALGDWIAPYIGSDVSVGRALAFILLWIGVPVGLSLLAYMLTKAVETVKLGGLNRLGGSFVGRIEIHGVSELCVECRVQDTSDFRLDGRAFPSVLSGPCHVR